MAPRRGGAYSACDDLFADYTARVNFGYYVVSILIFTKVSIALCCMRKNSSEGRKLIGPVYMVALFSMIISFVLNFVLLITIGCGAATKQHDDGSYISSNILSSLGIWGLLFVVFYKLNNMLRKQLGAVGMIYKAIPLVLLGLLFTLYIAQICLSSYIKVDYFNVIWNHSEGLYPTMLKLFLATKAVYLLMVLVSAALTGMTISALRKRRLPGGDLLGWAALLYLSMLVWTVFSLALAAMNFTAAYTGFETTYALSFVLTFFQALSFLALLGIASHICWNDNGMFTQQVYAPVMQQQTAYGYGGEQSDYYQQPPALVHVR